MTSIHQTEVVTIPAGMIPGYQEDREEGDAPYIAVTNAKGHAVQVLRVSPGSARDKAATWHELARAAAAAAEYWESRDYADYGVVAS